MNLLHVKYALEVARTRSITKAAENLYMGQPSLSRAIKDLEDSLGIAIFKRTSKGIVPTQQGEEFLSRAAGILKSVGDLEKMFRPENEENLQFSISVPRANYVSFAFKNFIDRVDKTKELEFNYKETNSLRAINNILQSNYNLAIIRFKKIYQSYFMQLLKDKEMKSEDILEFEYVLLMSENHPLAEKDAITFDDLKDYVQVLHGDPYVPSLPFAQLKQVEFSDIGARHIYIYERGSQFELLSGSRDAFMIVAPLPPETLSQYALVQRRIKDGAVIGKDLLISKKNYRYTATDRLFMEELYRARDLVTQIEIS